MIKLSPEEYTAFQNALMRAWQCALRALPVTDGNAERVANVLMQGAYEALQAGEREEESLADAALARLSVAGAGTFDLDMAMFHDASPTNSLGPSALPDTRSMRPRVPAKAGDPGLRTARSPSAALFLVDGPGQPAIPSSRRPIARRVHELSGLTGRNMRRMA